MFDKLQQLKDLARMRSQAQALQKELAKIIKSVSRGNIKVNVTGEQKIDYLEIDGVARDDVKDAINETMKEVQKEAAKKMLEMGGGLSGLLGGLK